MEDDDDTKRIMNTPLTWEKRQQRILADLALMTSFK